MVRCGGLLRRGGLRRGFGGFEEGDCLKTLWRLDLFGFWNGLVTREWEWQSGGIDVQSG